MFSHVIILVWLTPLSKWVIAETSRQHPLDMDNNACIYFTDVSVYKGAICLTGTCPRRTHPAKVLYIYIFIYIRHGWWIRTKTLWLLIIIINLLGQCTKVFAAVFIEELHSSGQKRSGASCWTGICMFKRRAIKIQGLEQVRFGDLA